MVPTRSSSSPHAAILVDSGIFEKHPEWAEDQIIPSQFSGEPYYDPEHRWIGSCISSFGICYNPETVKRNSLRPRAEDADDLGRSRLSALPP